MWRWIVAIFLVAPSAFSQTQTSAYHALRTVGTQFHRAALKRVISVSGVDGDPQPVKWNVLIADRSAPGGVRQLQIAGGKIVSNQTPTGITGSAEGPTLDTSRLNLDSTGAFSVASHTADQSHVNFSFVTYTLRVNDRGAPVWIVTIQDETRSPLGTIHINATRGNVVRVEGMYHGANMAQVEQDPPTRREREYVEQNPPPKGEREYASGGEAEYVEGEDAEAGEEEDDGDVNPIKAEIKRRFRRTKEDAARIFQKVRRPFDDFFHRG